MSEQLKPCPFCGGAARVVELPKGFARVVCATCGNRTWDHDSDRDSEQDNAIRAWNRRAPLQESAPVQEEREHMIRVIFPKDVPADSWLRWPEYKWFLDALSYAATQTRAIPALSIVDPHDLYFAVDAILQRAPTGGSTTRETTESEVRQPDNAERQSGNPPATSPVVAESSTAATGAVDGIVFLLLRGDTVLLEKCPRKREVLRVGEWFVPGGKIEAGENEQQALCREAREEMGIEIRDAWRLPIIEGSPVPPTDKGLFLMRPFVVTDFEGEIPMQSIEDGTPYRWTPISEALQSPVPQVRGMVAMAAVLRTPPASTQTDDKDSALEAHTYLTRLLGIIAPNVEPLHTLLGVCTQIDNAIVGLRRTQTDGTFEELLDTALRLHRGVWHDRLASRRAAARAALLAHVARLEADKERLLKAASDLSANLHRVGYAESFRYLTQLDALDDAIMGTV